MLDEKAAKVFGFQVVVRVEGMNDPHLVAGAAGGDVEALLEEFLVAHGKGAALRGVHERDENDIALVALELRGIAAEQTMEFVAIGRNMCAQEIVDFERLFIADERNNAEAERLARAVVLILGLLYRGSDERRGGQGLLAIDFAIAAGARNTIGNRVREQMHAAGVAQRLDAPIVRNHVAELNDFRDATEMFDKASSASEGLPREVVNGNLTVVEIGVRNAGQVLENEVLNDAEILADSGGADLFVVADDEDGFAKVERGQGHDVALAGFVNDDDVETRVARIEILYDPRKRHDPDGHSTAALGHFSSRFGAQQPDANAVAFANPADGIEPADERLPLVRGSAASLPGPGAAVDQIDRHAAKAFAEFFDLGLQRF